MGLRYNLEDDYVGELNVDERKILNLMILYPHLSPKRISRMLGISMKVVNSIIRAPKFLREYESYTSAPLKILEEIKSMAAIRLRDIIYKSENENTLLKAISMALNKEIYGEKTESAETNLTIVDWNDDNKS